jgi:hypothetical protein
MWQAMRCAPRSASGQASGADGTVSYDIGGALLQWSLQKRLLDGQVRTFTGISSINRIGTAEIEIPSFSLFDSGTGLSILTMDATLIRFGYEFRGTVEVFDGEPSSSWDDYTHLLVQVTDNNDTDGDGLPDLISLPEPGGLVMLANGVIFLAVAGRRRIGR